MSQLNIFENKISCTSLSKKIETIFLLLMWKYRHETQLKRLKFAREVALSFKIREQKNYISGVKYLHRNSFSSVKNRGRTLNDVKKRTSYFF